MIHSYALLLFGGDIAIDHQHQCIVMDGWIRLRVPGKVAVLVRELRSQLHELLCQKFANSRLDITETDLVNICTELLTHDGLI